MFLVLLYTSNIKILNNDSSFVQKNRRERQEGMWPMKCELNW